MDLSAVGREGLTECTILLPHTPRKVKLKPPP